MSCSIRFAGNNFIGAGVTSSTFQTAYPLANIYDTRRSLIGKFRGNFLITALNNKVYINDGANKTATLANAEYTGTTLAAQIQTQLNAVSTNWTCTYSLTTFRFTIARSSGTSTLKISTTTNAAWDLIGFVGVLDLTPLSNLADEPRIHGEEFVQVDLGAPQEINFAGLIGPITESIGLSPAAEVRIQGNNINDWTAPQTNVLMDISGGAFGYPDTAQRFWRISIKDRKNTLGPNALSISYMSISTAVKFEVTNIANGFSIRTVDPSLPILSENGTAYFFTKPKYWSLNGNIQIVVGDERRDLEQFFYSAAISQPFFISIDPLLKSFETQIEVTKFVRFTSPPSLQHVIKDYFTASFDVSEAV